MPVIYDTDDDDGQKEKGERLTPAIYCVAEYAHTTFDAALDLPVDMFRNMLRNYIISQLQQTPKGKEKLKLWRRLQTTTVDTSNLDFFNNL